MITEMDVLEAWIYWHKKGLIPPDVDDLNDFKKKIHAMYCNLKNENLYRFKEAVVIVGQNVKRWPTIFDIQTAIRQQSLLNKV